jgi:hypothetical protein
MTEHKCIYCENTFKNKVVLKTHQTKTKYCLVLQGKTAERIFQCGVCAREFTTKVSFDRHKGTHTDSEFLCVRRNTELEYEVARLQEQLLAKDDLVSNLKDNVQRLERALERVASKPSTSTTNNLNINNFTPLTNALMSQQAPRLTGEHMLEEDGEGYARLVTDICKGNVMCSDYARSILKWKNENDTVTDPKGHKLWKLFCTGIRERNDEVFKEIQNKVQVKMSEDPDVGFAEAMRASDNRRDIRYGADGEESELQRIVIERLCRLERV